jgi:hypothetical protein
LRQIKACSGIVCDRQPGQFTWFIRGRSAMPVNVGTIDQYARIVVGLALLAFAFQDGLSIQGWHWVGLLGLVLLGTAFFKRCPLYSMLGMSSCEVRR